jgi:hypothetical protein
MPKGCRSLSRWKYTGYHCQMTEGPARGEAEAAKLHAELGGLLLFTSGLNNVEGVD